MFVQAHDEVVAVKALLQDFIKRQQCAGVVAAKQAVCYVEVVVVVEDVQVVDHRFVGELAALRIGNDQVKDGERVAQGAICFLRNEVQRLVFCLYIFLFGYYF